MTNVRTMAKIDLNIEINREVLGTITSKERKEDKQPEGAHTR